MSSELAKILGATPPASVAALDEAVLARLAGQVAEAKERMRVEMEASVQTAIAGVPFAVRGIVKKAVLG